MGFTLFLGFLIVSAMMVIALRSNKFFGLIYLKYILKPFASTRRAQWIDENEASLAELFSWSGEVQLEIPEVYSGLVWMDRVPCKYIHLPAKDMFINAAARRIKSLLDNNRVEAAAALYVGFKTLLQDRAEYIAQTDRERKELEELSHWLLLQRDKTSELTDRANAIYMFGNDGERYLYPLHKIYSLLGTMGIAKHWALAYKEGIYNFNDEIITVGKQVEEAEALIEKLEKFQIEDRAVYSRANSK